MKLEELAGRIFEAAETSGVAHMAVGALAAGAYGIPRATKDVDLLVGSMKEEGISRLMTALEGFVEFEAQVQFDTLTWGRRWVGSSKTSPPYKVELFEMFEEPFVISEFDRRTRLFVPLLRREIWLPTAEDVVVQKLRWGRSKDLDDARDVLAVQDPATLDMDYVRKWCAEHGTTERLEAALAGIPPL